MPSRVLAEADVIGRDNGGYAAAADGHGGTEGFDGDDGAFVFKHQPRVKLDLHRKARRVRRVDGELADIACELVIAAEIGAPRRDGSEATGVFHRLDHEVLDQARRPVRPAGVGVIFEFVHARLLNDARTVDDGGGGELIHHDLSGLQRIGRCRRGMPRCQREELRRRLAGDVRQRAGAKRKEKDKRRTAPRETMKRVHCAFTSGTFLPMRKRAGSSWARETIRSSAVTRSRVSETSCGIWVSPSLLMRLIAGPLTRRS